MNSLIKKAIFFSFSVCIAHGSFAEQSRLTTPKQMVSLVDFHFTLCKISAELILLELEGNTTTWSDVEECTQSGKKSILKGYKDLRNNSKLNEEAIRSLKELVAYAQVSLDMLYPSSSITKYQYEEMIAERAAGIKEKANMLLLDVM